MNRQQRRNYWKANHKAEELGTWEDYNLRFTKRTPYINHEKRAPKV